MHPAKDDGKLRVSEGAATSREDSLTIEETQTEVASDHVIAARLAGEFFIRGVEIIARAHDGDLLKGIIFTAIAVANSEANPVEAVDGQRRPVSVMSVASSIGVPYETTRRYVNLLVSKGLCERMGRSGVVATDVAFSRPGMIGAYQETYTSFNRLVTALRRARYPGAG